MKNGYHQNVNNRVNLNNKEKPINIYTMDNIYKFILGLIEKYNCNISYKY